MRNLDAMPPSSLADFERLVGQAVGAGTPSVAYGVAWRGETILLGAAGVADRPGTAATPGTPYAVASVTKPMTATAVAMLAERSLVDLDAPIERYLGGLRLDGKAGPSQDATVRRVLNHSAGLPLHYRFYYADENPVRRPFDEVVARYGKLLFSPGTRHVYSNLGYGLLDRVIENVAGRSYPRFMAEEVLGPLGMADASIGPRAGAAVGYAPNGAAYPPYDTDHPGGSAAFASVEDLLAFGRFHLGEGPSVLSPEGRRAMQRPTFGYGLGWAVADRHGLRVVGHTGSMGGVSAALRLVPSLGLVVALVANGEGGVSWRLADDALSALDEGFRSGLAGERERPGAFVSDPTPHGVWSGFVETPFDRLPLEIEPRSGRVRLDGEERSLDEVSFREGRLRGHFGGDLGVASELAPPIRLHLDLGPTAGEFSGAVSAVTSGRPDGRVGDALSFWAELERT